MVELVSLQREVMTLILRDNVAEKSAVDLSAGHLGGPRQEGEVREIYINSMVPAEKISWSFESGREGVC